MIAKKPKELISIAEEKFATIRKNYTDIINSKNPEVARKKFRELMKSYRSYTIPQKENKNKESATPKERLEKAILNFQLPNDIFRNKIVSEINLMKDIPDYKYNRDYKNSLDSITQEVKRYISSILNSEEAKKSLESFNNLKEEFEAYRKYVESNKDREKTAAEVKKELTPLQIREKLNSILLEAKQRIKAYKLLSERYNKGELKGLYKKSDDFYDYYHDLREAYAKQLDLPAIEKLRFLIKEVIKDFKSFTDNIKAKAAWDGPWMYQEEGKNIKDVAQIEERTNDKGETEKGYFSLFDKPIGKDIISVMDFVLSSKFMDFLKKKLKSISQPGLTQITGPRYDEIDKFMGKLEKLGEAVDKFNPTKIFKDLQDKLLKGVQIAEKLKSKKIKEEKKNKILVPPVPSTPPAAPTSSIEKLSFAPIASYLRKCASVLITGGDVPKSDLKEIHKRRQLSKKQHAWERYQKRNRPTGDITVPGFFLEPDMIDEFIDALERDHFDFMKSMSDAGEPMGKIPLNKDPDAPDSPSTIDYAKMKKMDERALPEKRRNQYDPGLDEIVSKVLLKGKKNLRAHVLENDIHMVKDLKKKVSRILSEYTDADIESKNINEKITALNEDDNYKGKLTALAHFINAPENEIEQILDSDKDLLDFYHTQVQLLSEKQKSKIRIEKGKEKAEKKVYDERFTLKRRLMKYLEKYVPHKDKDTLEEKRGKILKRIQLLQNELKSYANKNEDFNAMNQEIKTLDSNIKAMKNEASSKGVSYEDIPGYTDAVDKLDKLRESVKGYNSTQLGLASANRDLENLKRPEKEVDSEEYKKAVNLLHKSMQDSEIIPKLLNEINFAQLDAKKFKDYIEQQEATISKDKMYTFFNMNSWRSEKDRAERQLDYTEQQLEFDRKKLEKIKSEIAQKAEEKDKKDLVEDYNIADNAVSTSIENMLSLKNYLAFLDKRLKKYEEEVKSKEPAILNEIKNLLNEPVFDQKTPRVEADKLKLDQINDAETLNSKVDDIGTVAKQFADNAKALGESLNRVRGMLLNLAKAPISKEVHDNFYHKLTQREKQIDILIQHLRKGSIQFYSAINKILESLSPEEKTKYQEILRKKMLPVPVFNAQPSLKSDVPSSDISQKEAGTGEPVKEMDSPEVTTPAKYYEKIPEQKVMDWDIIEALYENDARSMRYKDMFKKGTLVLDDPKAGERIREVTKDVKQLSSRLDNLGKLKNLTVTINDKPIKVSEVGKEFNKLFDEYTRKKNELSMRQNNLLMKKADLKFQLTELLNLIGLDPKKVMSDASDEVQLMKKKQPEKPIDMAAVLDSVIQSEKTPEFDGFTEKEVESIEDQFYRDMFWTLMKRWGDKIGENVVFGKKTKPEFSMIYDTFKNLTGVKSNSILSGIIRSASEARRMIKDLKRKLSDMERAYRGTNHDVTKTSEYKDTLNRVEHLNKLIAQKKVMYKIIDSQVDADGKIKVLEKIKEKTTDEGLIALIDKKIKSYRDQAEAIANDNARAAEEEETKLVNEIGSMGEERLPLKTPSPTPQVEKTAYDKNHRDFNLNILYGSYMQSKIAEMLFEETKVSK